MKAKTKIEKEKAKLASLEQALASTQEAYDTLHKQRNGIIDKMRKSQERLCAFEREAFDISAGFTEEYIKWLLKHDGTATKYLELSSLSKATNGQLSFQGYFYMTEQNALRLRLCKNENFDLAEEYLNKFLPHYLPQMYDDHYNKVVDIFEHTLSEYGSYRLSIKENDIIIYKCTYGRDSVVKNFDNLHDALKYISTYLYYE